MKFGVVPTAIPIHPERLIRGDTMKFALSTLIAVAGVAAGLLFVQPAAAQLPGNACSADSQGTYMKTMLWFEDFQEWILTDLFCATDGSGNYTWSQVGGIVARLGPERPDGVHFTGRFGGDGMPEVVTTGPSALAKPPAGTTYWNTGVSRILQRELSAYGFAGDICNALRNGDVTGNSIDPSHVYRIGNDWHHISDPDDREAFGMPDARMSSIWGYRTEYYDHDDDPLTPKRGRRVPRIPACASE